MTIPKTCLNCRKLFNPTKRNISKHAKDTRADIYAIWLKNSDCIKYINIADGSDYEV